MKIFAISAYILFCVLVVGWLVVHVVRDGIARGRKGGCWIGFHDWDYKSQHGTGIVACYLKCRRCGKIDLIGVG